MSEALSTSLSIPVSADDAEAALVRRLVTAHGARWVGPEDLPDFLGRRGEQALFFSGDPVRFPEALDVAVVLPELQRAVAPRLRVGVVRRAGEDALAQRFGVQRWPSLVFLRDGQYVTTVAGMLDWTDYLARVAEALSLPTRRAPIALQGAGATPSACH